MKKSNIIDHQQKNQASRTKGLSSKLHKSIFGFLMLILLTTIMSCAKTDIQSEVEFIEANICSEEHFIASSTNRNAGGTYYVLFRQDFPSQIANQTIMIKKPSWLSTKSQHALRRAIMALSFNNGLTFTLNESVPYDAEIRITKWGMDGCNAGVSEPGPNDNGLSTQIRLQNNVQDQSQEYIQSLFMHEIGHCIGLEHPNSFIPSGMSSVANDNGEYALYNYLMTGTDCSPPIVVTDLYPSERLTLEHMFGVN